MTDVELLQQLNLSIPVAAEIIGISRQVLHRALKPHDGVSGRRGVAKSNPSSANYYLNADRLLAIWRHYVENGDARAANLIRDIVIERHPGVGEMIAPYMERTDDPESIHFSECWIFSREPFEIHYPEFRRKVKSQLQSVERRLVYFVPSADVASKLLTVLQVASDGRLNHVYIVITSAVLLCPHWFVAFIPSDQRGKPDEVLAGVMPEPPAGKESWEQTVKVPENYFRNARDTLMQVGLLDARDRFRLPSTRDVGGGALPEFIIYYPDVEASA
jgi:hypothetical protein